MKRMVLLAALLVVLAAPAASATSTLDKDRVVASTDVEVTIDAPVGALKAYNQKQIVEVPDGFRVLWCGKVEQFTCTQSTVEHPRRTWLTWERAANDPPLAVGTDHFPFRMHTIDKAGTYVFVLHQFYADGSVADSGAKLAVVPGAARAATATSVTDAQVHTAAAAPTRAKFVTVTTEPAWFADSGGELAERELGAPGPDAPVESRAGLMVLFGVIATAAAGFVFWVRRHAAPED